MKRFLIMFMVLGLLAGSMATAEAAKRAKKPIRVERTVEGSYDTQFVPFAGMVTHTCPHGNAPTVGCFTVQTRTKEAFLEAAVTDAHGQPVLVTVTGPGSDQDWIEYGTFCGETKEPISFDPGVELAFHIGFWHWPLPTGLTDCRPMFGTTGTISVTLSNLP